MNELLLLLVVGGLAAAELVRARGRGRRDIERWTTAAVVLGMSERRPRLGLRSSVSGLVDGLRVRFSAAPRRAEGSATLVEVEAPELLPEQLQLRRENLSTAFEKRFGSAELELGDREFDDAVFVRGVGVLVAAVLDRDTREAVADFVARGGSVTGGVLRLAVVEPGDAAPGLLDREAARVVELARRLASPKDPAARLARNVREDPVAGIRHRNLRLLVERFPGRSETRKALGAGLGDPDPAVRLLAARHLDKDGEAVLEELAADPATPPEVAVAAMAVRGLGSKLPEEWLSTLLEQAEKSGRTATAVAVVELLGARGGAKAIARLQSLLESGHEAVVAAAVRSLVAADAPQLETILVGTITHPGRVVRHAVIGALRQVGTVRAVPALQAVARSHPFDRPLNQAVAQAVAAIQGRLYGASTGRLALVGGEGGQLSLSRADDGGLSLAGADGATTEEAPAETGGD